MSLLTELRPKRATEIIDATVHLYRDHAGVLLMIAAAVILPPVILGALLPPATGRVVEAVGGLLLAVGQGAMCLVVAAALEGAPIDAGTALSRIGGRAGTLIAVQLLVGIAFVIGIILLVVPGILVLVWTAVALPVAAIERAGVGQALSRSRALTRGMAGHVFGTLVLALVIFFVLLIGTAAALGAVAGLLGIGERLVGLLGNLMMVAFYPIFGVAITLLYYDLRVRREGADLEAMATELLSQPGAPTPSAR